MSIANPLWGAPRIHGELLKIGIASQMVIIRKCQLAVPVRAGKEET
jgi:hypothetical protein